MAIRFCKISSPEPVIAYLALTISRHLAEGEKILWLVSGGSAINIVVEVAKRLESADIDNVANLTVSLIDERYGSVGHPDSNWQQLKDAGLKIDGANLRPVLKNKSLEQTVKDYAKLIGQAFKEYDYKIGSVGIGADGHTLGIKPHSPATTSDGLVCAYPWDDYVRLTLTPRTIAEFDEIVAYVVGEEKRRVLQRLNKSIPPEDQPAQYLKSARKLTVYNDDKGEPV